MTDKIDQITTDVAYLKRWTERHEDRHGDDADMLALVLKDLDTHTNNHHGRTSEIKRMASITTILAILAGVVEVMRQFFL